MKVWKMILLFNWVIFLYFFKVPAVNLPGMYCHFFHGDLACDLGDFMPPVFSQVLKKIIALSVLEEFFSWVLDATWVKFKRCLNTQGTDCCRFNICIIFYLSSPWLWED